VPDQPTFEPFEDDGLRLPPCDVELVMLKRGRDTYVVRLESIDWISFDIGHDEPYELINLHIDARLQDIHGTPSCYIDYRDGRFRVWPTPDRDIEAVVVSEVE
jgi:hypothetical protein